MYSEKVMSHFKNPHNVGEMEDADGVGEIGNPVCGDMMTFYIKVDGNVIKDVKFKTFGCGAAIAVSSMISDMATGKTIDEALKITNADVAVELGGLPNNKLHCSNLGADALHKAIEDYLNRKSGLKKEAKPAPEIKEVKDDSCKCPYCQKATESEEDTCRICKVSFRRCPKCLSPVKKEDIACPKCGEKLR